MKCFKSIFLSVVAIGFLVFLDANVQAQENTPTAGAQIELKLAASDGGEVGYLLYLPKDFKADADKKFRLLFFLHGRGESNGPLSLVAKWGPPMMAARGDDLPYVIVSPQCPRDDRWTSETQQKRLVELLDVVVKKYNIDDQKICLTGLSMGGYGSWKWRPASPLDLRRSRRFVEAEIQTTLRNLKAFRFGFFMAIETVRSSLKNLLKWSMQSKRQVARRFDLHRLSTSDTTAGQRLMRLRSCINGWKSSRGQRKGIKSG